MGEVKFLAALLCGVWCEVEGRGEGGLFGCCIVCVGVWHNSMGTNIQCTKRSTYHHIPHASRYRQVG